MNYKEAVRWLGFFVDYEKRISYPASFKLSRQRRLLRLLGNPHKGLKVIHIAGTKGKGSAAAMTASILKEAGFKTGLYTSPHLSSFRERIQLNGRLITKKDVSELASGFRKIIKSNRRYSFFEVYTALAFLYFRKEKADFVVLEVGLGGRLDATNVVNPLACGITHIGLEHMDRLGQTLGEIAAEKAGIIKRWSRVVVSPQPENVLERFRRECLKKKAKLWLVGEDVSFKEVRPVARFAAGRQIEANPPESPFNKGGEEGDSGIYQICDIKGIFDEYRQIKLPLLGRHQLANAALAVGLVESLRFSGVIISPAGIKKGLQKVRWPGRLEVRSRSPLLVLDGAQNGSSALALKRAIKRHFVYQRLILILGISQDKNIKGIGRALKQIADVVILTRADNPRAAVPEKIKEQIAWGDKPLILTDSVSEAVQEAKKIARNRDLILVTGSLFVVGEARGFF